MDVDTDRGTAIADAAACLAAGALALVPTETVYGVGVAVSAFAGTDGLPSEGSGYRRIFSLKQRDLAQTVPWLVDGLAALARYGREVPDAAMALAEEFWPGALTIVVKAAPDVPAFMQAADGTVALRASACEVIQRLIAALNSPLAVTSANTHGRPAPASFAEAEPRIVEGVDIAFDAGATTCREASTIVSCENGEVTLLREGAIPEEALARALAKRHIDTPIRKGC